VSDVDFTFYHVTIQCLEYSGWLPLARVFYHVAFIFYNDSILVLD